MCSLQLFNKQFSKPQVQASDRSKPHVETADWEGKTTCDENKEDTLQVINTFHRSLVYLVPISVEQKVLQWIYFWLQWYYF